MKTFVAVIKEIWNTLKYCCFTVLIVVLILNFVLVNAYIPSGSMENTLMIGNRIIGVRFLHNYKRGDIIIFKSPDGDGKYLIKRIIGLPGETLEVKADISGVMHTYIDGNILEEDYLKEPMKYADDFKIEIPEDGYFCMGDNRNNSYDARFWENKIVSKDAITGIAKLRYFPFNKVKVIE